MCIHCKIVDQFPQFDVARAFIKKLREDYPMCFPCMELAASGKNPRHQICTRNYMERNRLFVESELRPQMEELHNFQHRLREDPVFFGRYRGALN